MKRWYWSILLLCLVLVGCENQPIHDPSAHLVFSQDTLSFDTVFTHEGSAVRTVLLRNPHKKALTIRSVSMEKGEAFRLNMDGEQDLSLIRDLSIAGGDSLFIFVRATIRPDNRTQPLLMEDHVLVEVGDHTERLTLQAYGWDVHLIDSLIITSDTHFTNEKPYLVRHWIKVAPEATLTLDAGTQMYMHDGAFLSCQGSLEAKGTAEQRVLIQSDRLDNIYDGIPYIYCGGKWDGIYGMDPSRMTFHHTDILSGNIGCYVQGKGADSTGQHTDFIMHSCRVHNHSLYGVVLMDALGTIGNSEISNCAEYGVYLSGGEYDINYTTIASYFNATVYAIQTTERNDKIAPLYLNNLSKTRPTKLLFRNSILAGAQRNCLMVATPLPDHVSSRFTYSYLQTDTLPTGCAHDNAYPHFMANPAQMYRDTVFVNTYYSDKSQYYDFHLDSVSPAIGIADPADVALYPYDLDGNPRDAEHPDAGCYQGF